MKEKPGYYAILTADVRYDKNLKAIEKLLFAEITALCNKYGKCWATNKYFADLYGVTKTSISKYISKLQEQGYIKAVMIYKDNSKEIDKRYLHINNTPIAQGLNTPIDHTLKDNITSINNTSNNKKDVDKSTTSPKEKTYKDKPISKIDIEPILQDIGRDSTEGYSLRIAKHLNNFFIKYYQELGLKPTKYMVEAKTGKEMVHIKSLLNSYQEKYIRDVIKFLTKEKSKDAEFWRGNVRSCKGFKDKFDKLVIAMKNKRDDKNNML